MKGEEDSGQIDHPFFADGDFVVAGVRGNSLMTALFLLVVDSGCVLVSTFVAAWFTAQTDGAAAVLDHFSDHLAYFAVFVVVWLWAATWQQLFISHRKDRLRSQLYSVLKAALVALVFCGFVLAFFTPLGAQPRFLMYFGLSTLVFISLFRASLRLGVWTVRQWGYDPRRVVFVGSNPRTRNLVSVLRSHPRYGYEIIGILEDDVERLEHLKEFDIPHLGGFKELERLLVEEIVDEVHVCLPVRSYYETIQSIAHLCVGVGVSVRLIADLFPLRLATSRLHRIEGIPMLSLSTVPEGTVALALKRTIDIAASLVGLVLLSPVFLVTAILIKLDSPGPVFFRQVRVGKNQRRFDIVKFRSMVADAEGQRAELEELNEADGPVFKIRDDPRITRVGKYIRKLSIDELPQLFNVLKGEMSLVGPRPPIPSEVEQYTWDQRRRLSVKPGMTGLWQVSGRSDLSFKEWVDLDLAYIDSWSIFQDFWILLKTFQVVVQGRGAA